MADPLSASLRAPVETAAAWYELQASDTPMLLRVHGREHRMLVAGIVHTPDGLDVKLQEESAGPGVLDVIGSEWPRAFAKP